MIRQITTAAIFVALATPALSLSCMRPDVARSFQQALEAEEQYTVVTGTLSFEERKLPKASGNDSPDSTRISARITGWALMDTGFDFEFDRKIILDVQCFGPWCGGAGSGEEYLTFLKKEARGYVMIADPCGSMMFQDPSAEMLQTARECFAAKGCPN